MLEKLFHLSDRKSSVKTEIISGFTVFLSIAYILPVNTYMLSETGLSPSAVFFATAISAAVASLIMGLAANLPIALAPGMGLNAFFTYSIVFGLGYTPGEALGAVFFSGVIFLILSLTGFRKKVIDAIPLAIKYAIGAGIGFFIAFIGLKNMGIIVDNPATLVAVGDLTKPYVLLGVIGVIVTLILHVKEVKYAIFKGMLSTLTIGFILSLLGVNNMPSFDETTILKFDEATSSLFLGFKSFGSLFFDGDGFRLESLVVIFTLLFVDFFDTAGTLIAVGEQAGLTNEKGELQGSKNALIADATGTIVGSIVGTSNVTSFVESSAGVKVGGRTGLSSVVVAILFILSLAFYPILSLFNGVIVEGVSYSPVTGPALVIVGILMISSLRLIKWEDSVLVISSFFIIIFMLLGYSIATGIAAGFIVYPIMMLATGRVKEMNWIIIFIFAVSILYFL